MQIINMLHNNNKLIKTTYFCIHMTCSTEQFVIHVILVGFANCVIIVFIKSTYTAMQ